MQIAFIGIGNVGFPLADTLARLEHDVSIAARDVQSKNVREAMSRNPALVALPAPEAVAKAQVIFLATPFAAVEPALREAGDLAGKIVVDCTNPVAPGLVHGLGSRISGGETIQNLVPEAKVVKAFNIYGFENFTDSAYPGYGALRPAMFLAGNDAAAKQTVGDLCQELGWEVVDAGGIAMSLHLEHMALLWINIARVQGRGADFVWAILRR